MCSSNAGTSRTVGVLSIEPPRTGSRSPRELDRRHPRAVTRRSGSGALVAPQSDSPEEIAGGEHPDTDGGRQVPELRIQQRHRVLVQDEFGGHETDEGEGNHEAEAPLDRLGINA